MRFRFANPWGFRFANPWGFRFGFRFANPWGLVSESVGFSFRIRGV